jgi:hypothetical protein
VPNIVNWPTPLVGPVKSARPSIVPEPDALVNRPVPPVISQVPVNVNPVGVCSATKSSSATTSAPLAAVKWYVAVSCPSEEIHHLVSGFNCRSAEVPGFPIARHMNAYDGKIYGVFEYRVESRVERHLVFGGRWLRRKY